MLVKIFDPQPKFCEMRAGILELSLKLLTAIGLLKKFDLFLRQKAIGSLELCFELSDGTIGFSLSIRAQTPLLVLRTEQQRLHSVRDEDEHKNRQVVEKHKDINSTCNSSTCPRYI
jgi:hypothetical protein